MKLTMRYPVLARRADRGWCLAVKCGEFDIRSATDEEMPVEIDFTSEIEAHRGQYKFDESDHSLYGHPLGLDRLAKIERKDFTLGYSAVHPMWPLFERAWREIRRLGKNVDVDRIGGQVHYVPTAVSILDQLDTVQMREWDEAARSVAEGLVLIEGQLWRKTDEPYLLVSKGRPQWSIFSWHAEGVQPLGDDTFAFSMTEYEAADGLVNDKSPNGGRTETALRIGGRYSYSNNSLIYSVMATSTGVRNYFQNLVARANGIDAYTLEKLPLSIIRKYVDLREIVETPFAEIGDDEAGRAVEILSGLESECRRIKLKPPFTPRMVRDLIERWDDREVAVPIGTPTRVPRA
ncbi:hypothetical protein HFN89_06100 [Rhizobium laguerreae]|nr:hypothetical protein [Rhizobium laguerreae]